MLFIFAKNVLDRRATVTLLNINLFFLAWAALTSFGKKLLSLSLCWKQDVFINYHWKEAYKDPSTLWPTCIYACTNCTPTKKAHIHCYLKSVAIERGTLANQRKEGNRTGSVVTVCVHHRHRNSSQRVNNASHSLKKAGKRLLPCSATRGERRDKDRERNRQVAERDRYSTETDTKRWKYTAQTKRKWQKSSVRWEAAARVRKKAWLWHHILVTAGSTSLVWKTPETYVTWWDTAFQLSLFHLQCDTRTNTHMHQYNMRYKLQTSTVNPRNMSAQRIHEPQLESPAVSQPTRCAIRPSAFHLHT